MHPGYSPNLPRLVPLSTRSYPPRIPLSAGSGTRSPCKRCPHLASPVRLCQAGSSVLAGHVRTCPAVTTVSGRQDKFGLDPRFLAGLQTFCKRFARRAHTLRLAMHARCTFYRADPAYPATAGSGPADRLGDALRHYVERHHACRVKQNRSRAPRGWRPARSRSDIERRSRPASTHPPIQPGGDVDARRCRAAPERRHSSLTGQCSWRAGRSVLATSAAPPRFAADPTQRSRARCSARILLGRARDRTRWSLRRSARTRRGSHA